MTPQQGFTAKLAPAMPVAVTQPTCGLTQQTVVTGTRAADTVYQNPAPGAMWVLTTWSLGGTNATIIAKTDANNPPTTAVAAIQDPSTAQSVTMTLMFPVLAGNYYTCVVSGGSPTLGGWVEFT
jgi:hypothetical protein